MNTSEVLQRIFRLKLQLEVCDTEDAEYIFAQIDEQIKTLQSLNGATESEINILIQKRYPAWLDSKFMAEGGTAERLGENI